ncbi:single-stranded-DNA-specific exonuclease RecJ [Pelagibius litoralis]|uniref:Single-stranded-DNA-specific exonuclease RecJ n=1 Tax=Pelagibius litoralis TaxID=374515 RepID=A0A967C5U7_9PROT|nr:single-stranded-DNA-specific exonuclease RecJ [Pelagibius litoralis]NIA67077.1 single-stranded-DNA-specific exonuclease RecJ [Pelagibius litoralis]
MAATPPAVQDRASREAERGCFLGVERSLTGKRWEERLGEARHGLALAQQLGLPEIVGRVLAARGVAPEEAERFLSPTLRDYLPDPSGFADMERAAARLAKAIGDGEKVAVFGDYDVDGATSSALLWRFFAALGIDLEIYIPDRLAEGYGPNAPALKRLRAGGVSLAITVDCGITAFDALAEAAAAGLEVVVVDHHAAEPRLPTAAAVVNPNRLDDSSGQGQMAAVGVTFMLIVALNRALRDSGWYRSSGQSEPDLRQWLDLVALGTVCDVVPLTGVNRALVAQGLKVMSRRGNAGLAALSDVARIDERPGTYHAGFLLGPRVNAGGRVGEAPLGARLLCSDDPGEAAEIAARLDAYNAERREIEAQVLDQAIRQVEDHGPGQGLVVAASEGWHAGVIGIVASRLKERYNRPALVIALDGPLGKGSGRSVPGVDLGAAVIAARQDGLLVNGGGHPMAAGLTLESGRLADLTGFLDDRLGRRLAEIAYRPSLGIDGALQPKSANLELLAQLERCAPFGVGNVQPRFVLPAVKVAQASVVGENHVRCFLSGAAGGRLKAIAFRALDSDLGPALLQTAGLPLHVAGRLQIDRWGGVETVQFIVEDAAPLAA